MVLGGSRHAEGSSGPRRASAVRIMFAFLLMRCRPDSQRSAGPVGRRAAYWISFCSRWALTCWRQTGAAERSANQWWDMASGMLLRHGGCCQQACSSGWQIPVHRRCPQKLKSRVHHVFEGDSTSHRGVERRRTAISAVAIRQRSTCPGPRPSRSHAHAAPPSVTSSGADHLDNPPATGGIQARHARRHAVDDDGAIGTTPGSRARPRRRAGRSAHGAVGAPAWCSSAPGVRHPVGRSPPLARSRRPPAHSPRRVRQPYSAARRRRPALARSSRSFRPARCTAPARTRTQAAHVATMTPSRHAIRMLAAHAPAGQRGAVLHHVDRPGH